MAKVNHALRREIKQLLDNEDYEVAIELMMEDWRKQPYYQALSLKQKEMAETTVSFVFDFAYSYMDRTPDKWNNNDWDEVILDIFPGKMTADLAFFEQVVPTLSNFILFHDQTTGYFTSGGLKAIYILDLHEECIERSQDSTIWGPAKAMLMENGGKPPSIVWGCLKIIPLLLINLLIIIFKLPFILIGKIVNYFRLK